MDHHRTHTGRRLGAAAIISLTALMAAPTIEAAVIAWGAAQGITGDSNVNTTGTLVDAFVLDQQQIISSFLPASAPPTITVNGVTFVNFPVSGASTTVGNYKLDLGSPFYAGDLGAVPIPPYSLLSTDYKAFLNVGIVASSAELTISGLNIGDSYTFQWWSNQSNSGTTGKATTAGGAPLDANTTDADGGLGQFQIGTFIADNSAQTITFLTTGPGSDVVLNGFQLRQLAIAPPVTPVPEPGSALAGMLALGLCAIRAGRRHGGCE